MPQRSREILAAEALAEAGCGCISVRFSDLFVVEIGKASHRAGPFHLEFHSPHPNILALVLVWLHHADSQTASLAESC